MIDALLTARIAAGDGLTIQSITESIKRGEGYLDGKVSNIKLPALIIWGKQDGLVTLANGERFKREISGAQFVVFDSCGHVPQIEKAAEFNSTLLKFLEGK